MLIKQLSAHRFPGVHNKKILKDFCVIKFQKYLHCYTSPKEGNLETPAPFFLLAQYKIS